MERINREQRIQLVPGIARHNSVYREFLRMVGRKITDETKIFRDNLLFPNRVRVSDWEIEMYLRTISHVKPIQLRSLFTGSADGQLELHIVDQRVEISKDQNNFLADQGLSSRTTEGNLNVLEKQSSWKINDQHLGYFIRAYNVPAVVAIEFRKNPGNQQFNPKIKIHKEKLEGMQYDPTPEDFSHRKSFLRKPMTTEEMREHLLFIDAEFTGPQIDKGRGLVSITILNQAGEIVLNEFTTPRQCMKNTGESFHGITERMMRGKKDEYTIIEMIQKLCYGKILVGHDLQAELSILNINKKALLGIRDLAATKTFEKAGIFPNNGGNLFKLQTIAEKILNKKIQKEGQHSSLEDAQTIRKIYRLIEHIYCDHKEWSAEPLKTCKRKTQSGETASSSRQVKKNNIGRRMYNN